MITKVKKYILSFLVIISSAVYVVLGRQNSPAASFKSAPSPNTGTSASTNQNYKDGQYTGSVADAYYGNIQVKAIVQNGKISDVVFLDYPQDRQTSLRINQGAMPILKQEAILAQSASVNVVSGATDTSQAFQDSLGSALTQATQN